MYFILFTTLGLAWVGMGQASQQGSHVRNARKSRRAEADNIAEPARVAISISAVAEMEKLGPQDVTNGVLAEVPSSENTKTSQTAARSPATHRPHNTCWTAPIVDAFLDVDVSCSFPPVKQVTKTIRTQEEDIIKLMGETFITPGMPKLDVRVLPDDVGAKDLVRHTLPELLMPHNDTCAGKQQFAASSSGEAIYNNIKSLVDTFDIYTKCAKAYVPNQENGVPRMRTHDVIAIVAEPFDGHFTLSYEDVALYDEYVDKEGTKTLVAIITSRKQNVIEGNYDIKMQLFTNQTVRLEYIKRQNLAESLLKRGVRKLQYMVVTQQSVDATMLKLAYAGLYGPTALDETDGCYIRKWCIDYFTLQVGDPCTEDKHCASGKCRKKNRFCLWSCELECAAFAS